MCKREAEEILKQDPPIAGLILMLPAGAALVPVLKLFLQMKLDGVDELALAALDHHLVSAKIRRREQFKPLGDLIQLQSVILPHAKNSRLTWITG